MSKFIKVDVATRIECDKLDHASRVRWYNRNILPSVRKYQEKGYTYETSKKFAETSFEMDGGIMYVTELNH